VIVHNSDGTQMITWGQLSAKKPSSQTFVQVAVGSSKGNLYTLRLTFYLTPFKEEAVGDECSVDAWVHRCRWTARLGIFSRSPQAEWACGASAVWL